MTGLPTLRKELVDYMIDILQGLDVQEDAGNPHEVVFINGIHPVDKPKKYVWDLSNLEYAMSALLYEYDLRRWGSSDMIDTYLDEREEALNK